MKIAMILNTAPLDISYDVDQNGSVYKTRLVNCLSDGDINALKTALTIGDEVDVYSIGKNKPDNLLRSALAVGASTARHIGDKDWPEVPQPEMIAQALSYVLKNKYSLLIMADNGSPVTGNEICAYLAKALDLPAFTSVIRIEKEENHLRLLRKLEKGKRQIIKSGMPALIALLPTKLWTDPLSLEQKLKAQESPLSLRRISYYSLLRKTVRPVGINISWQAKPLAPAPQEVAHPLNNFHPKKRLEQLINNTGSSRNAIKVSGTSKECAEKIIEYLVKERLIIKNN